MKAILIDVFNENIRQVELDEKNILKGMYKHIGCDLVDSVWINDHDTIMVDDEGLLSLTRDSKFFSFDGNMYAGNGLVVGCDEEGNTVEPDISIDELKVHINFHTYIDVYMLSLTGGIKN